MICSIVQSTLIQIHTVLHQDWSQTIMMRLVILIKIVHMAVMFAVSCHTIIIQVFTIYGSVPSIFNCESSYISFKCGKFHIILLTLALFVNRTDECSSFRCWNRQVEWGAKVSKIIFTVMLWNFCLIISIYRFQNLPFFKTSTDLILYAGGNTNGADGYHLMNFCPKW